MTGEAGLLRFITCGSVDDGKSTLIGRLLLDTGQVLEDQAERLARDSRRHGTTGDAPDPALLLDGLQAEREQGITIDVAYRFMTTPRRRFIVADTPGHEQYTRNMATGASTADLAVLLVDARRGVVTQTRRHALIARLFGIRQVVLAVNKMDLVDFDRGIFASIVAEFAAFSGGLGFAGVRAIPMCGLDGDNVTTRSGRMGWYRGPHLLEHLESVAVPVDGAGEGFRMPVQWVNRPHDGFRGYAGTVASGGVSVGDPVAGPGWGSRVGKVIVAGQVQGSASTGDAVTLVLTDDVDLSRGDVLVGSGVEVETADQFQAHLVWLDAQPLVVGRTYLFKLGTAVVSGSVTRIRHRVDVDSGGTLGAEVLEANDVGVVTVSLQRAVSFLPFARSRALGGFIVIDRQTNATAAAGMVDFAQARSGNLAWQAVTIGKAARASQKGQRPRVIWFTGLSGSGKSTIANLVEQKLFALGRHTFLLDGDNVRHGLNRDLGFSAADRAENIRRVAEVAAMMVDAGLIVLVSFISPYAAERRMARALFESGEFLEVFVDTPVEECRRRDVKGLYAKADAGLLPEFTGVSAPYEAPAAAELHLRTLEGDAEAMAVAVMAVLSGEASS